LGIAASSWQAVLATHAKRQALASETKALDAQASEVKLRRQAEADELAARQRAYASDMNVARLALEGNNLGWALDLLDRQRPAPAQKDLRGWEWRYLWQQTRSDALFTLCQQSSQIISLATSPDGNLLALITRLPGGISVWDLRTRQEFVRLAENETVSVAAFSPTEPLLAFTSTGPAGSKLQIWNAATHQMVGEFPVEGPCGGLAFAKDGLTLVTSTSGHTTLWDVANGSRRVAYPFGTGAGAPTNGFATTPTLSLAAYGLGNQVRVVDLRDGKEVCTEVVPSYSGVALSPDGKTLATAQYGESDIHLWDVATGVEIGRLQGHLSHAQSMVFWPDGKTLASASTDQTIRTWDVASHKCLDVLQGHRQEVWRLILMSDGKTLVSGAKDGTVCFWDASVSHLTQARIKLLDDAITWCFTSDSRSVLTVNSQGQLSQWSGSEFQHRESLLEIGGATGDLHIFSSGYPCRFSHDGRFLAVGFTDGTLQVWNVSRRVVSVRLATGIPNIRPLRLFSDDQKLIGAGGSNAVHEWDLASGLEIRTWHSPELSRPDAFDLSPDERSLLYVRSGNGLLQNLADQSSTFFRLDVLEEDAVRYSPDGRFIAVASNLGYARVFDAANWRTVANLGGFLRGVHSLGFSRDGHRLLTGSSETQGLKLWDTDSWQDLYTLETTGAKAPAYDAAFSPDGNSIGWMGSNGKLYLWRAPSWAEIDAAENPDHQQRGP
jgi:WD40 repeat protein